MGTKKETMKYFIILLMIIFQGCATTQSGKTLKDFRSTSSLCIDGLLINMYASKCDIIEKREIKEQLVLLSCVKHSKEKQDTVWLLNDFFLMPQGSHIPANIKPICGDPLGIVGTTEKD